MVCNRWTVVPRNSTVNNDFPKESSFNGRNFVYYFWGEISGLNVQRELGSDNLLILLHY